ncbi:Zn(2)-C6 fungal-type domain-containing protein [Fusarium keratoplasticum]|uniref:Zn(2)-C6 fungal-type domain-containing protein n=1 Tax=Fusarium keratoplasticum TaxID=1328300 RepID=A0ACC0QJC7_9HYPO|nr:Zn(2)-C6 fungal-type domain-containing protein [Fusarium keratoplasticum]KAI8652908.1 Zn(2)-C6 fungal-type domain-containing protein [Fusarium keratoplasticum]
MSSSDAQDRGARNEDGGQDPSGAHDGPAVAPCDNENGDEKRGDVVEVATGASAGAESLEKPERPVKKMKRGKYISRACTISSEILARLDAVERHLRLMRPPGSDSTIPPLNHISPDEQLKHSPAKLQSALEADGQTFAGEITMNPAFEDDNETLDHNSVVSSGLRLEHSSPASSLHPPATSPGELGVRKGRWWFDSILAQHGVNIDENQSRYYLQVYLDEIHPMYPFIHPPAIWETFNEMWQYSTPWPTAESAEGEHMRVSMALSLLQDLLETSNTATKSLLMLQVLIVRVIYLFRLDANQKAARVLALTVSVAHTIGIHRQSTIDTMPAFYNQLYCRAWWVIYMIDRRIALESGKPFLIQDSNVDTALPIDLSDEWMTRFSTRNETMAELQHEITAEVDRDILPSPIPYVVAMIRYSRVAGKAWEVLYGVKASSAPTFAMVEYVDTVLCKLLDTAPKNLRYDPDEPYESQFSTSLRWQIKQTVILSTCCTYLRLLIRRPLLPSSRPLSLTEEDDLESSIECAGLAAKILTAHQNIKDDLIKYSFALSHYVTSCAMIMIALVSRELGSKKRYGSLVLAATQSLILYSHKYTKLWQGT